MHVCHLFSLGGFVVKRSGAYAITRFENLIIDAYLKKIMLLRDVDATSVMNCNEAVTTWRAPMRRCVATSSGADRLLG
jgi:hypothetical protein